jgi:hypothetical protein
MPEGEEAVMGEREPMVEREPVVVAEYEPVVERGARRDRAVCESSRSKVPVHATKPHLGRCGLRDKHREPQ